MQIRLCLFSQVFSQFVQLRNLSERLDSVDNMAFEVFMNSSVIGFAFFPETVQPGSRRQAAYPDASEQHIACHVQKRCFALPAVGLVPALKLEIIRQIYCAGP